MYKTLYVDIDEEITSIIDRVRKTSAPEIIVVVPKRALLIQSLVNLKLLKKEANRRKKRIMIVTQDRIGKKLIEKAGILVQGKMDDSMIEEGIVEEKSAGAQAEPSREFSQDEEDEKPIGSSDYFDEPLPMPEKSGNIGEVSFEKKGRGGEVQQGLEARKKMEKEPKTKGQKAKKESSIRMSDIVASPKPKRKRKVKTSGAEERRKKETPSRGSYFQFRETERQKNIKAEKFFQVPPFTSPSFSRKEDKTLRVTRIKGKSGKYFAFFLATFFVFGAVAGAYFFLPRATIILRLKTQEKGIAQNIEAGTNVSGIEAEDRKIPATLEQLVKEKSEDFEATGSRSGSGKTSGKIVIYNEFSSDNQPLVATTRFETSDGKIFRITKNIIVPGMTQVGGETKHGAIEVEVVADKPGEEYNIGPSTFKIPGFKGGPKYEKFYAKSEKAMEGGAKGESIAVTSQDVAKAKEELISKAKKEALDELKKNIGEGRFFFEDTAKVDLVNSSSSASVGTQAEKFTYSVSVKAQVLSFRERDVKELMREKEQAGDAELVQMEFNQNLNYILSESDIENGFVKFEVKTDVNVAGGIDLANFKKGVLGKNSQELENLIKNYPAITSADVNFWPFFISRVPMSEKRVKIEVQ